MAKVVQDPPAVASSLSGRISLTGQCITTEQASKPWVKKDYTFYDTVFTSWRGNWLELEDDLANRREQIIVEQTNLGLMSALLLTIAIPYMMGVQDLNFDSTVNMLTRESVTEDAASGEDMARAHRDVLSVVSFLSFVGFILSTTHSVLTMLFLSQLTGVVEPRIFHERLGSLNSAGLLLFLFGVLFLMALVFYHFIIFASYVATILVGVISIGIIVCAYVFGVATRQQNVLFNIKRLSYTTAPTTLDHKQLDGYAVEYCEKPDLGPQTMTAANLEEFIRDRLANDKRKDKSVSRPSEIMFSEVTTRMIEMYATKIVEACALQAIKDSPLLMSLSKADEAPDATLDKVIAEAKKGDQLCKLISKGSMAA
jgi:hypothetical protein